MEIILVGSTRSEGALKDGRRMDGSLCQNHITLERLHQPLLVLKMEEGHELRHMDCLQQLEKAKKPRLFLRASRKKCSPDYNLILAQ